jgi:NOL1/NOP2/fmu family ribosome biogenesis protein
MKLRFIKSNEKRKILAELNEIFGIEEIPYLLIEAGKEKLRGYSGSLNKEELIELASFANVEIIGSYIIKKEKTHRLSLDATQIFAKQINKSIIEIDQDQYEHWIRGYNLQIENPSGVYIMKYGEDFIGSGISTGQAILNHIPKERRLKTPLPSKE